MQIPLFTLDTPNVDGASAFLDGQAFIFVSSRFPPRMLFTLAHELGHLIASGPSERGFAVMDPVGRTGKASRGRPVAELFADTFAGCLLLPAAGVGIALKKVRELLKVAADAIGDVELLYLSRIFGVSFQVAARRCEDLGLLPVGGAKSIYDFLRREFGSPEKRAELLHLPARPEVKFPVVSERLLRACIEKVRTGDLSLGRASMILGLSSSEIVAANAPTTH
jgi:Zn-dependent peptidase ImmA (M78 family)